MAEQFSLENGVPDLEAEMLSLPVLILVGGRGTRLGDSIGSRPKPLALVGGRPFLLYLLDQLDSNGFRFVTLCTGYRGEQLRSVVGAHYKRLKIGYSLESEPLGTGGAAKLAMEQSDATTFLVMNGDSYVDTRLATFAAWHHHRESAASIVLVETSNASRFGSVELNNDGQIVNFQEKTGRAKRSMINGGVYLLRREVVNDVPAAQPFSLEADLFPSLIEKGLMGYPTKARFIDIGTPESLRAAQLFFEKGDVTP